MKRTLEALMKMGHRSGDINGEGDGCGLMTDIPRRLWTTYLEEAGRPGWLAEDRRFFVGHLMIPLAERKRSDDLKAHILKLMQEAGLDLLLERRGFTRPRVLGHMARSQEPEFWQVAGLASQCSLEDIDSTLFELLLAIERETPVHVASLSAHSVVYKVQGSIETLRKYYPELLHPDYLSAITIGHSRYSTNTLSTFERVQPFSLMGHNGEFNTIARLRLEAQTVGIQLVPGGSDSQDLNRILETLIFRYGFSLIEALELIFPPILHEVGQLPPELQTLHRAYRRLWGPLAQGPAAIVARYGDTAAFCVDALGLRPLWFGETEKEFFFSSERGVVPLEIMLRDPKPLAPGEKMALQVERGRGVQILDYHQIQQMLLRTAQQRFGTLKDLAALQVSTTAHHPILRQAQDTAWGPANLSWDRDRWLAALGWSREDVAFIRDLATSGADPVGSLGYDGPLAVLSQERQNLADYFKEAVAVVTNPSIDRERETEHFSTQAVIGPRPPLEPGAPLSSPAVEVALPILLGGQPEPLLPLARELALARETGTLRLEDLMEALETVTLTTAFRQGEGLEKGLRRLAAEAVAAARAGAHLILLDDGASFADDNPSGLSPSGRSLWLDPHLAVAACDTALRQATDRPNPSGSNSSGRSLRRRVGLVLRSG
ncbi:MAG: glutamate synthase central domain-containing protein, partial [Anaerolineae bacterium]